MRVGKVGARRAVFLRVQQVGDEVGEEGLGKLLPVNLLTLRRLSLQANTRGDQRVLLRLDGIVLGHVHVLELDHALLVVEVEL